MLVFGERQAVYGISSSGLRIGRGHSNREEVPHRFDFVRGVLLEVARELEAELAGAVGRPDREAYLQKHGGCENNYYPGKRATISGHVGPKTPRHRVAQHYPVLPKPAPLVWTDPCVRRPVDAGVDMRQIDLLAKWQHCVVHQVTLYLGQVKAQDRAFVAQDLKRVRTAERRGPVHWNQGTQGSPCRPGVGKPVCPVGSRKVPLKG